MIRGYTMTASTSLRVCGLALAFGLMTSHGAARAATPASPVAATQSPALSVSDIDFKRGTAGEGRLILQFSGDGAVPDLRNQGDSVIVDIGNASLPANLQKPLNVVDFATPVQRIDAHSVDHGAELVLSTKGGFDSLAYQTGNQYVVEISPRSDKKAMGASSGAVPDAAAGKRAYTGTPATFNFQDIPVRTVLQLIAEQSNLNIVASDTVSGNITLRLDRVPWDQALDIVLRAKGLDKRRDGNVMWVAPQQELAKFEQDKEDARIALEQREEMVTDYIQINYHSATAIAKIIDSSRTGGGGGGGGSSGAQNDGFLSERGRVIADERTNMLLVNDIPKKIAHMRELINQIDKPVDQVLIEGRIVIATDSFARDLGAKFGVGDSKGDGTLGSTTTGGATAAANGLNVNLPVGAGIYTKGNAASMAYTLLRGGFNLDLELSAMQTESRGEVVSNPRIVTTNQHTGEIKQGTQIPYVTTTGGGTAGGVATPNVQFKDALLDLKVTPTITNDGRVFLDLDLTKNDVGQTITLEGYGTVPTIDTREVTTAVLVDDGQTVVIGGVYEFTDQSSVSKVPFLGDIPFLGNLFKQKGRQKNKAELLVFITPKVLQVAKK